VHRIVLFSLYEFYFDGFSYEVFNEAISALCMSYHLVFPHRIFLRWYCKGIHMIIMVFSPIFSHWVLRRFILIYQCISKFFPTGVFKIKYYDEHWNIRKIIDQGECWEYSYILNDQLATANSSYQNLHKGVHGSGHAPATGLHGHMYINVFNVH
jgi:hypothetical protein